MCLSASTLPSHIFITYFTNEDHLEESLGLKKHKLDSENWASSRWCHLYWYGERAGEVVRTVHSCLWPLSGLAETPPGTGRARSQLGTLLQHPGLEGCQQVPHLGNWQGKGTPACNCLFHSHANTRNAFCFHGNSVRNKNHHEKLHPSRKEKFNHLEHALLRTPPEAHPRTLCLPNTQQWKQEEDIVTRKRWQGGYSEATWLSVNLATDKTYFFYNTNFLPRRYIYMYILIQGY